MYICLKNTQATGLLAKLRLTCSLLAVLAQWKFHGTGSSQRWHTKDLFLEGLQSFMALGLGFRV